MAKHKIYSDVFGFTQLQIASLLNISRSQWSHYIRGFKSIPSKAELLLDEILFYMHSDQAKAIKKLPPLEEAEENSILMLRKQLKEMDFQLQSTSKSIDKEQQKKDRLFKTLLATGYLRKRSAEKSEVPHQLLEPTLQEATIDLKNTAFRLNMLLAQKELQQLQYDWLKKEVGEL